MLILALKGEDLKQNLKERGKENKLKTKLMQNRTIDLSYYSVYKITHSTSYFINC